MEFSRSVVRFRNLRREGNESVKVDRKERKKEREREKKSNLSS
jgi:hypothetical protein